MTTPHQDPTPHQHLTDALRDAIARRDHLAAAMYAHALQTPPADKDTPQ